MEQFGLLFVLGALAFAALAFAAHYRHRAWRRRAASGGILGGLAVLCYALAYTVAPNIPTPPVSLLARFAQNPTPDAPATVAAGRDLYARNCVVCHGAQGRGDGPAAFTLIPRPVNLQVHTPNHAPGEVHHWVTNGIAGTSMPAYPQLSDTERWQIVRYLYALAAGRT